MVSLPELFLGNAIKSLIFSCPPIIAHNRSNPKAIPPCGGAPYSNASIKKPNCSLASLSEKPKCLNISCCNSLSCILILPPPISFPFKTKSYALALTLPGSLSNKTRSSFFGAVNGWCIA